jgi:hypothetical protein
MDERIARTLNSINELEQLAQFEINLRRQNAVSDEVADALNARSAQLARTVLAARTGIELSNLTPAEERIVDAVSWYIKQAEFQEQADEYADYMQDDWKERWRGERDTERSVSEMFGSLKEDRE